MTQARVSPSWTLAESMEALAALYTVIQSIAPNAVLASAEEKLRAEVNAARERFPEERERLDAELPFRKGLLNDT